MNARKNTRMKYKERKNVEGEKGDENEDERKNKSRRFVYTSRLYGLDHKRGRSCFCQLLQCQLTTLPFLTEWKTSIRDTNTDCIVG